MSNPKEGEDEEAEEYFYESLDRILSSSSASSTTVSDEDTQTPTTVPKFPISASNYDIWVSEPLSIQERRKRLLHEMGLSNDPLLSRRDGEFSRSMSYDRRKGKIGEELDSNCFVVRSKSDGETARAAVASTSSNSSTSSSSIHSVDVILVKPHCNSQSNRPPTGRKLEEIRPVNPKKLNVMRVSGDLDNGVLENHSDCNGLVEGFKIKNLDNGMEFVVNGARNDQVREIGSGEQITMKEFEMRVGHSPIVQELLRRQNVEGVDGKKDGVDSIGNGLVLKKKGNWFKSLRNVAGAVSGYNHKERRSSDERDNLSEKGGRRSSSATDDGQDLMFNFNEKVKVRQHGKSSKDLTAVYKNQEIQAHNGSIWSIKFSLDGRFLASAGEDCVIHVWQVIESDYKGEFLVDKMENVHLNSCVGAGGSEDPKLVPSHFEIQSEKRRRGRASVNRKSVSLDHVVLPDCIFGLSEIPVCSLLGHVRDVLDLSWSKSQFLLSSSMDKTVRLWHVDSKSCLKVFSHSDYVTCIQFNPVDDRYFISGSLDSKVRIWNIPVRQVVDWSDIHEMVTAACYTPDGQNALVGSSKGSCLMYNTSENKLQHISQIDLQNKKKKSHLKKITRFQFTPGSSSEVLITSADSRIRVVNGVDLVHKYKGFRNTNSQISASFAANGKFVVCASEDSYVYVWEKEGDSQPSRCKGVNVTQSYEYFPCRNVSVAIPWPGICGIAPNRHSNDDNISAVDQSSSEVHESNGCEESTSLSGCTNGSLHSAVSSLSSSYFFDRLLVTWPEEKFHMPNKKGSPLGNLDASDGVRQDTPAWGMVIVTANLKGEIKIFQNFGLPVQI